MLLALVHLLMQFLRWQAIQRSAAVVPQVEAEANTVSRPLPGFTPRKGKGLPLFGKSESTPPSSPASQSPLTFQCSVSYMNILARRQHAGCQ